MTQLSRVTATQRPVHVKLDARRLLEFSPFVFPDAGFIVSRSWPASTRCLSCRSPTALWATCVNGCRSCLC